MQDFTIVRRGFEPREVDTYIVSLESQIEKRDKKIEEYRSREDAISRAVVEAQMMADSIIEKAKEEASRLKEEATARLESLRAEALQLRNSLTEFQESYNRILRRYLYSSHCDDLRKLYDRLDELLSEIGIDPNTLPKYPPVHEKPPEDGGDSGTSFFTSIDNDGLAHVLNEALASEPQDETSAADVSDFSRHGAPADHTEGV